MIKIYNKIILILVFCSFVSFSKTNENLKLEKLIIFSRHGLRTPLVRPDSDVAKATPYEWNKWNNKPGNLAAKGVIMETYFGQYINEWLTEKKFLSQGECPNKEEIYVYTNSFQRTIATGESIINGLFPGCGIKAKYKMKIGEMDPVFNPVVRRDDKEFQEKALAELNIKGANKKLKAAYEILENVVDYKNSELCLKENKCKFSDEIKMTYQKGKNPGIKGDITLGTHLTDTLLVEYYAGFPLEKIANGNIKTNKEWQEINKIKNIRGELMRGGKDISKHIAYPLINVINNEVTDPNHKVTILVGHDSNIVPLLSALEVKEYTLEKQYETTPIGGKVFFEIWKDEKSNQRKVKVEYVYQTAEQLRNGTVLSLKNPPKHTVLEMKNCKTDKDGFCSYNDFQKILKNIVDNEKE